MNTLVDTLSHRVARYLEKRGVLKRDAEYDGTDLMGAFERVGMSFTGIGTYQGAIPGHSKGTYIRYYIEAIANNSAGTATYKPVGAEHNVFVYQVESASVVGGPVAINEIMPANETTAMDEEGDFGDWME